MSDLFAFSIAKKEKKNIPLDSYEDIEIEATAFPPINLSNFTKLQYLHLSFADNASGIPTYLDLSKCPLIILTLGNVSNLTSVKIKTVAGLTPDGEWFSSARQNDNGDGTVTYSK